mmetsp:Transcript_45649/g.97513  ORF Transcript_45649/g.97513 Transcript_45649/m.97513 type:complete len:411 (+) Transcript_45649:79-1311(+)
MNCQRRTDTTFACNVVGRREMDLSLKAHRDRITNMKTCLNTTPPTPQPHLTLYGRDYSAKKRATTEAAFSDLKMIQAIAKTMTRKQEIDERKGPVSLNADARRHDIHRIMQENHRMLSAIENVQPTMQVKHMIKKDEHRKRYIINASHTARLSGEYESTLTKIRHEDRQLREQQLRSVQQKRDARDRLRSTAGTVSLPSLHPNGASAAEGDSAHGSPPPRSSVSSPGGTAPMRRSASAGGGASSSQDAQEAPSRQRRNSRPSEIDPASAVAPAVSFSPTTGGEAPATRRSFRSSTPHPSKMPNSEDLDAGDEGEPPKAPPPSQGKAEAEQEEEAVAKAAPIPDEEPLAKAVPATEEAPAPEAEAPAAEAAVEAPGTATAVAAEPVAQTPVDEAPTEINYEKMVVKEEAPQ